MTDTATAATAGTDTGATTTDTTTTTAATGAATSNDAWYSSYDSETKNWLDSKGWSDPDPIKSLQKIIPSGRNAEQLISKIKGDPSRILVMPKDMNNADEVSAFYEKLGVPKDIKDYGLDIENPNMKSFVEMAQKAGIPKEAAGKFTEWAKSIAEQSQIAEVQKYQETSASEMQEWQREMGTNFDAKMQAAKTAFTAFPELKENSADIEKAMGTKKYMTFMSSIGSKIGEAGAAGAGGAGGNGDGGMTPSAAKQAIQAIQMDSVKSSALLDDSHPMHSVIKAEWIRLHGFANPQM